MRHLLTAIPYATLILAVSACSAPETRRAAPAPNGGPESDAVSDTMHEPMSEPSPEPARLTEEQLAAYGFPYEFVEGEPLFRVIERDAIPSIDEPQFVGVDEAMEWMQFDESVLGVVGVNGTAKCYSAWQLDSHEIVNDEIDGHSIAATW